MSNTENIVKKINKNSVFSNLPDSVAVLSNDISVFLAEEIEELNISSHIFRTGMERSLSRVMNLVIKQTQQVLIFPDSIPGLTLIVLKKNLNINSVEKIDVKRSAVEEMREAKVLENVIDRFFKKQNQKVLLIENPEIIFALFPVADTRKNLKELELYITF